MCLEMTVVFILLFFQPSVFELVRSPDFANLPLIVEDFIKDSGGSYTGRSLLSLLKGQFNQKWKSCDNQQNIHTVLFNFDAIQ